MSPFVISISSGQDDGDRGVHRSVPESDSDPRYSDCGQLGGYSPSKEPFSPPSDVHFECGFGAEMDDVKRGYCDVSISDDPAYDFWEQKNRSVKGGFLNRPRLPTERG